MKERKNMPKKLTDLLRSSMSDWETSHWHVAFWGRTTGPGPVEKFNPLGKPSET